MSVIYRDPLAQSLPLYREALRPALRAGRLFEFPLTPLDRLGLPLWTVALIGEDGALSDGFGYGAGWDAARTSAWGEAVEWHAAREALRTMPRLRATYAEMRRQGRDALDPLTLCLSAGSDYAPDETVLEWVEVKRHPSGERAWAPVEFVAPRAADIGPGADPSRLLAVPITNGLGAGPTLAHAVAHGVLELLQRDGNSVSYRAMGRGVRVELDDVRDPATRDLLEFLNAEGVEVLVKLAATDFGLANLYVVGHDRDPARAPQPISLSACGEAVHPDREFALAKALREFTMARARKAFNHGPLAPVRAAAPPGYLESFRPTSMRSEDGRALREMRGWAPLSHREFWEMLRRPVFDVRQTVRFSELPTTDAPDADALLMLLTDRLGAEGLGIYYADFTPPEAPVSVVKVIVPGLEVETMTYERIGVRNLRRLLARGSDLVGLGDPPPTAKPIRLPGAGAPQFAGAWFDPAAKERAVGPLYPLYREPGRHVIGFLEEAETAGGKPV